MPIALTSVRVIGAVSIISSALTGGAGHQEYPSAQRSELHVRDALRRCDPQIRRRLRHFFLLMVVGVESLVLSGC